MYLASLHLSLRSFANWEGFSIEKDIYKCTFYVKVIDGIERLICRSIIAAKRYLNRQNSFELTYSFCYPPFTWLSIPVIIITSIPRNGFPWEFNGNYSWLNVAAIIAPCNSKSLCHLVRQVNNRARAGPHSRVPRRLTDTSMDVGMEWTTAGCCVLLQL